MKNPIRAFFVASLAVGILAAAQAQPWDGQIVHYGSMREAIGKQQHEGRVRLGEVTRQAHFYGVGALEGLTGEVTVLDGQVIATEVDSQGQLKPIQGTRPATLLVGSYVGEWAEQTVESRVNPGAMDDFLRQAARQSGIDAPLFPFCVEGELRDIRLHVIHGACPMHARIHKVELGKEVLPFEADLESVRGTLVGVYAEDSVGTITHPDTAFHAHLVFTDPTSGATVTGHVERAGIEAGAELRLPAR